MLAAMFKNLNIVLHSASRQEQYMAKQSIPAVKKSKGYNKF